MDHRLTISYRGTAYAGWQRQTNALAVQQVLEEALEALLGEPVRTVGAGRTDAGVHARGQVVSLRLPRPWPAGALVHGTNRHLPDDVRVLAAAAAPAGFDARRHATWKEYRYRLRRAAVMSPLDAPFALRVAPAIDLDAMRRAAVLLPGRHDFTAFANQGGSHEDPRRRLFAAAWEEEGEELTLRVVGEGFLRGMVRVLVGTLLEVGSGRRRPDGLATLLAGAPRAAAGPTAPPQGLVLQAVGYGGEALPAVVT